ncbi:toxin-antitoxin system HicB family antitoxin [Gallibacter sp. Marseille-QA0791]|uniref:toxin-antitoxin system HicB family antitoxin n=1 Tax=Gallibacter sp. Marseille-QA0791 TaxID=3378781 RepID=UPI003D0DB251
METELKKREKAVKDKEKAKKQMVLRLSPSLWNEIAAWAEEDFRSINGQVEYLLSECVRRRKNKET